MALDSAQLQVLFNASQSGSNGLGNPVFSPALNKLLQFTTGTGASQADLMYAATRTVASATNDDLDLAGSLTNVFGATITNVEMVGVLIASDAANTTTLSIGAGSNPWITMWLATGDGIKVFPGGVFLNFAPDANGLGAVTASTGDILRVANGSGASATYSVVLLGRSA